MRRIAGSFLPPVSPGGSVRKPSTCVPSLLVALKRSTWPSFRPFSRRVVDVRDALEAALADARDLRGLLWRGLEHRDRPVRGEVERAHVALAAHHALDGAAVRPDARQVLVAAVLEQEQDRSPVGSEARRRDVAVEGSRQSLGGTARGRDQRYLARAVPEVLRVAAGDVRDRLAVRAEDGGRVAARARRHDVRDRALARLDHEDVRVQRAVRVRQRAVAHERDAGAVGRPGRVRVVEGAGAELEGGLLRDVEHVDVRANVLQVPVAVAHELQPPHDDRLRRLLLVLVGALLGRVGILVGDDDREALRVGRPGEGGNARPCSR